MNKTEDVVKKAIELVENGTLKDYGLKAKRFVEKYNWEDIMADFESILEKVIQGERNK